MKEFKSIDESLMIFALVLGDLENYSKKINDPIYDKTIKKMNQVLEHLALNLPANNFDIFFNECAELDAIIEQLSVIQDMDQKQLDTYSIDKLLLMPIDKLEEIKSTLSSYN